MHPNMEQVDDLAALRAGADRAMARREFAVAAELFDSLASSLQFDANTQFEAGVAYRLAGDADRALIKFDRVLALDPYHFIALLSKASLVEKRCVRAASRLYHDALSIAPPPQALPDYLRRQLARGRTVCKETAQSLANHLTEQFRRVRPAGYKLPDRFNAAMDVLAGLRAPESRHATLLHYPGLRDIGFLDRSQLPWLAELEAATPLITQDLVHLRGRGVGANDEPEPYIAFPPGQPVNQWADLNHSSRWSAYFLWRDGERNGRAAKHCAATLALLDTLPMAQIEGIAPNAMFSILQPRTHIPKHTGATNIRLTVHLPLIASDLAWLRVGDKTCRLEAGRAFAFDDTIEHEATNDADEDRTVLILDTWHPDLTDGERELLAIAVAARRAFFNDE